tara:strand:+ start:226 stop:447 length:222 start_codon:yes stop_codon:yes gene_type:complete
MSSEGRSALDDKQMLFTLLTALVKKNDGEIRISESEMDSVSKKDMMMMYYDKENKEIILSMHLLSGMDDNKFH